MDLSIDRVGWFSVGPLSGRPLQTAVVRLKAGSGREQTVRFRAN
jgi:hypothetical protein